jgi:hypothetical protein
MAEIQILSIVDVLAELDAVLQSKLSLPVSSFLGFAELRQLGTNTVPMVADAQTPGDWHAVMPDGPLPLFYHRLEHISLVPDSNKGGDNPAFRHECTLKMVLLLQLLYPVHPAFAAGQLLAAFPPTLGANLKIVLTPLALRTASLNVWRQEFGAVPLPANVLAFALDYRLAYSPLC